MIVRFIWERKKNVETEILRKLIFLVRRILDRAVVATKSSVTEMCAGLDDSWGKKTPLNVDSKVLGSKVLSNSQKR